jgi:phosphoglycolate phosphatase
MLIRAIIFDLDGTLLDTLADLAAAGNLALAEAGLTPLPQDAYRLLVGAGARNLMLRAAAASTGLPPEQILPGQVEALLAAFSQTYNRIWADQTKPYPGIQALLDRLLAADCKLAVLSNKPDPFTQMIVARYFPAGCFAAVAGQLAGWPIKPDPALALEICRQLGVDPAATAMVGDSGSDMTTALRAGMLPIGVLWGFRSARELLDGGAQQLATQPDDLADLLIEV